MAAEIEVKLGAWPGFEVPPLDGAIEGLTAEPHEPRELDATYHDAADLRLIRAGISLRHRDGEGGPAGAWTLKLPDEGGGPADALVREELVVPGPAATVPADLAALVRPWLRTAPLVPVAHLHTRRQSSALVLEAEQVGSIDDDEVSVLQNGRVAARFREVEVEVAESAPAGLVDAVVDRLRAAGAGAPDPTPKLVRALGPRALQPPDLTVAELGRHATAVEVISAGIANAVLRIVEHDRVIRADDDPEGIHQARVGTRRLRSDLRTFGPLLDTSWSEPLREELKWLASELGEVRDRDVLAGRLRAQVATLDAEDDRVAAAGVLVKLDRERSRAVARAIAALDSRRYLALLDRLVDATRAPRTLPEADVPVRAVLPALAGTAFHTLRKGVKKLGKRPADDELHRLRIKAKKARYAADVAVPVIGDQARAYTKAVGALQDVLGDHHDCAVAADWLRAAVPGATRAQAFALGLLVAGQQHQADELRRSWRSAWDDLDRSKLTSWLDG